MNPLKLIRALFGPVPRYSAASCLSRVRAGEATLVDVREPAEWAGGVAEGAALLPLRDLTGARVRWAAFLAANRNRELLLYCGAGVRSGMAARILNREGFRAANAGSLTEWTHAGWKIVAAEVHREQ
jgi:rhodanese-related sulfurtransferase